ncbi:MAG: DUF447 family protein [Nitrososphaerales archaeon]
MPKISLSDLGFIKNCIFEAIVSTYNIKNLPNAAPMGVITDDMHKLIIKPYTTSQTYRNLLSQKCAVINITSDPLVYYKTAFKDINDSNILLDWFEKANRVNAPKLKNADAYIEVRVTKIENKKDRAKVLCEVVDIVPVKITPKAYCRATFAVIESIIHTTRIKVFFLKDKRKTEELIRLVKYYETLVRRVAPSSIYSDIMKENLKRIEAWKENKDLIKNL